MMGSLYDTDVVEWAEQQAGLLRRHAAGEKLNVPLDWANIIEAVENVSRSELESIEDHWTLAFLHDLKAAAWPQARDVPHWLAQARLCRRLARRQYTPSMRSKLDLNELYDDALDGLPALLDGQEPLPVSGTCSITMDDLLQGKD